MVTTAKETTAQAAKRSYLRYQPFMIRPGEGKTVDDSFHLYMVLVFENDRDLAAFREKYGLPHEIFQDARLVKARLDPAYVVDEKKLPPPPKLSRRLAERIGPDPTVMDDIADLVGEEVVQDVIAGAPVPVDPD